MKMFIIPYVYDSIFVFHDNIHVDVIETLSFLLC